MAEGGAGVGRLLKRCLQWRARPQWYAATLGTNLLIWLLAYSALIGPGLLAAASTHWRLLGSVFLPSVAFGLLIPSIGEEPGWRNVSVTQERLGAQYTPPGRLFLNDA